MQQCNRWAFLHNPSDTVLLLRLSTAATIFRAITANSVLFCIRLPHNQQASTQSCDACLPNMQTRSHSDVHLLASFTQYRRKSVNCLADVISAIAIPADKPVKGLDVLTTLYISASQQGQGIPGCRSADQAPDIGRASTGKGRSCSDVLSDVFKSGCNGMGMGTFPGTCSVIRLLVG